MVVSNVRRTMSGRPSEAILIPDSAISAFTSGVAMAYTLLPPLLSFMKRTVATVEVRTSSGVTPKPILSNLSA